MEINLKRRKANISRATICLPANIAAQMEQRAQGRRTIIRHGGTLCCHCHAAAPASASDRWCRPCRNAYKSEREKADREELKRLRAEKEGGTP